MHSLPQVHLRQHMKGSVQQREEQPGQQDHLTQTQCWPLPGQRDHESEVLVCKAKLNLIQFDFL